MEQGQESVFAASRIADMAVSGGSVLNVAGMWTDGYVCSLAFPGNGAPDLDIDLRILCRAPDPAWPQTVDVYVNGYRLAQWVVEELAWQDVFIPAEAHRGGDVVVTLRLHHPIRPFALGINEDVRLLGVLLVEARSRPVRLVPATADGELLRLERGRSVGTGQDPSGRTTEVSNGFARTFEGLHAVRLKTMMRNGVLERQAEAGLIPGVRVFETSRALILLADKCDNRSVLGYPWSKLKAAATVWIDFNRTLVEGLPGEVCGTTDGHYSNFVSSTNGTPLWCDFGSVTNRWEKLLHGTHQFIGLLLLPLLLASEGSFALSELRPHMRRLRENREFRVADAAEIDERIRRFLSSGIPSRPDRFSQLDLLSEIVDGVRDPQNEPTEWAPANGSRLDSVWSGELDRGDGGRLLVRLVDFVRRLGPQRFLDLSPGDGSLCLAVAGIGVSSVAIGGGEMEMDALYRAARSHDGCTLQVDVREALATRDRADLVAALGLPESEFGADLESMTSTLRRLGDHTSRDLIVDLPIPGQSGSEWWTSVEDVLVSLFPTVVAQPSFDAARSRRRAAYFCSHERDRDVPR